MTSCSHAALLVNNFKYSTSTLFHDIHFRWNSFAISAFSYLSLPNISDKLWTPALKTWFSIFSSLSFHDLWISNNSSFSFFSVSFLLWKCSSSSSRLFFCSYFLFLQFWAAIYKHQLVFLYPTSYFTALPCFYLAVWYPGRHSFALHWGLSH